MPTSSPEWAIAPIIELLAERWRTRCRDLDGYLRATFGVSAPPMIPERLFLSQMVDGTIHPENIGHDFAAVWLVERDTVREVPLNFEWRTRWDTDESDCYYLMHSYSFVSEGDELLLSERYGPGLTHRFRGRLSIGPPLSAEWVTCWHSG
ncbi:MAG: hypothetical protein ACRC8S_17075 [Fimbriiglobus sp.]